MRPGDGVRLLATCLLLDTSEAGGQGFREEPSRTLAGVRRGSIEYSRAALRATCPSVLTSDSLAAVVNGHAEKGYRCTVDTVFALPSADGTQWMGATYSLFDVDAVQRADAKPDAVAAALFASRDSVSPWRLAWVGSEHIGAIRSVVPELARRPDGSALVGIEYCINGTGGCWQDFLTRRRGRWYHVEDAWRKQLPDIPGGRVGKGVGVELGTLTGSYGLYGPDDANCCPGRELVVTLAFRRDSLVLVRYVVRPWPQESAARPLAGRAAARDGEPHAPVPHPREGRRGQPPRGSTATGAT